MMPNLVLIDDDQQNCVLIQALLKPQGIEVFSANGGQAGLELVWKHHPDIVIVDLHLPESQGPDGWGIITQLKGSEYTKHIPIVVLTASTTYMLDANTTQPPLYDLYLTKPFRVNAFINALKSLLP